VFLQSFSNEAN